MSAECFEMMSDDDELHSYVDNEESIGLNDLRKKYCQLKVGLFETRGPVLG